MHIYFMAGVSTSPMFMEKFRNAMHQHFENSGKTVYSELLFPYGDMSRRLIRQLWEVRHDMRLGYRKLNKALGCNRVLAAIERNLNDGKDDRVLLIGHSGGGVAAVHAAALLLARRPGMKSSAVVMIGSPRCRIPAELRPSVLSLHAEGRRRKGISEEISTDFVTLLGSFGGWNLGLRKLPSWQVDKHAPAHIRTVPIIGGHADYFRDSTPYLNPTGKSNLEHTIEAILSWHSIS
ncbi:lipase family protein [Cohnella luojiensis]|uniref:Fungal lipase-type domain-containing protein n=1 Tax=Cohnella luojiensis TaxID=652876 RepID=A0A4Y8M8C5_9BACL|nr:hypothetical protein [Cohnella luojiensis]TFE31541.1 hypothetical protein E2980_00185 [Cohnella luojiensis]